MLPVYKAINFIKEANGGSTKPWIVNVLKDDGKIAPFVVKLFKTKHIEEASAVSKEVFASILSEEFGLDCPAPALIEFDSSFISTLSDKRTEELKAKDDRIKFGCELIEGGIIYSSALHKGFFRKYEIEDVYAFDFIINNVDRSKQEKPNILIKDNQFYLFDHELSLEINDTIFNDIKNGTPIYQFRKHLFYPYLQTKSNKEKISLFDTFYEHMKVLNVDILDRYKDQLVMYGHPIGNYALLQEYIRYIRDGKDQLLEILKRSIV